MKFAVHTLGCRVNQYDAESMAAALEDAGYERVEFGQPADVCIVATCVVTGESERKSRQMLRRAAAAYPGAVLVAAGCLSQRQPIQTAGIEGVNLVVGNSDRRRIAELIEAARAGGRNAVVSLIDAGFEELSVRHTGRHARANVKIQEGCDAHCSYCIIPSVRGPSRSRSLPDMVNECRTLAQAGCREIVLTGINLAAYGRDLEGTVGLADAVEAAVCAIGEGRVRLGSLDPDILTGDFLRRVAALGDRVCPHFHISLQSGCDSTLRRMRRRYNTRQYAQGIARVRAVLPGAAITTDVIAGFPGETEAEFEATLAFIKEIAFSRIHAFPYSPRSGTEAERMREQVPRRIRLERTARLNEAGGLLARMYAASLAGQTLRVLFEEATGDGLLEGYSGEFVRVRAPGPPGLIGKLRIVKTTYTDGETLAGVVQAHSGK
ncbi:MAG: tRNA (N(6)-L-threonylcarbamoyladenosine(37)-C(2))-methylthiotransferase MtaB [Clostridiales bacterium]|nr:tRNA (N(6)-L-threonylcarbamoyladenosine(37)-C(2))-methylthiotransferase MtaB [Clostridiales bacterium]